MNPEAESLNHRIRNEAAALGVPPIRLRNRLAFQRILARLARHDGWVLKGGFSLEVRLGLLARATKDLDVERLAGVSTALDLQDALDECLSVDLGDGFSFQVRLPKPMRLEESAPSTWRTVIDVFFSGTTFAASVIDIVPSTAGTLAHVEPLVVQPLIVGDTFTTPAIDVHRHAAEKVHAYTRVYAYAMPSSRVKDLVDLVLFAESGMLDDLALGNALREVFAERDTALPDELPQPPGDWAPTYAALAADTGVSDPSLEAAWQVAANLFTRAVDTKGLE